MRAYKIKQKSTGLYYIGFQWKNYKIKPAFSDESDVMSSTQVNYHIERAIRQGFRELLDDFEIENFELQDPKPIKGTLRMDTVRDRIEQKILVEKLKYGN